MMTEICHQERMALSELIALLPHLKIIVQRDKENDAMLKPQLAEVKAEMKPEPTGLIEAVDALVDSLITTKGYSNFDLEKVELALARERRIAEKRDRVISLLHSGGWLQNEWQLRNALRAYDEECAK